MKDEFNQLPEQGKNSAQTDSRKKGKGKIFKIQQIVSKAKNGLFLHSSKDWSAVNDIKKAFSHLNPQNVIISLGTGLLTIYLLTGIYIVNPGEQAVVRRFGAVLPQTVSEGIHYRLPYPIDQVQKVNVSEVRRADIGMNLPEHIHQKDDTPQDIQLLTGDENIIVSQAIVHYKVKDIAKFLYNVNGNSEQMVRNSVESALVTTMGKMEVDEILGSEKIKAQNMIMLQTQGTLDSYDAGIQITAFNIQAITPPDDVAAAFMDVTTAKEEKEKAINEANGYYNSQIPKSRAEANSILMQALVYKTEQINKATGESDKFNSMLEEYQNNSKIYSQDTTKYRLLLETLEKIIPKVKMYIVDSSDGSVDVKMFDPKSLTNLTVEKNSQ
jgi:membrane protease subunit HflK